MTTEDRGIHPDLLEEVQAEREQAAQDAPPPPPPPRGRGSRARAQTPAEPTPAPQDDVAEAEGGDAPETPAPPPAAPEWFAQVREAKDPTEALRSIIKNVPYDQLEKDEVFSGLIGRVSDRRIQQQRQADIERQKHEAAQNNDLYTLGELSQREMQEQQAAAQQQRAAADGGFMDGVVLFQSQLPEEIQQKVAGQTFGAGKGQAQGVAEYLQFISEERVKLKEAELEREFQRRESALRKSVLSEVNGDEPVPERDGGTPGRVREVTDEQIEAMTMQEYNALFDEAGRPKPGVRHRSTRGIPLTQR